MRTLQSRIFLAAGLAGLFCTAPSLSHAVDREVGAGKTYSTLQAAHDAAANGDRILVYSGTYTEDFIWTKSVDVVEATGETAIFRSSENAWGIPDEPVHCDGGTGTWDGIDYVQASYSDQGTMFYMKNSCTRTFRNFKITSDENGASTPTFNVKPFFCHDHPTVLVENVELDLRNLNNGNVFHSQVGARLTVINTTAVVNADSMAWINKAGNDLTTLDFSSCTLTNVRSGGRAFHALDATITAQDTEFSFSGNGTLFQTIGTGAAGVELTRCLVNASTNTQTSYSIANTDASANTIEMTNTAVLYRANGTGVTPIQADSGGTFVLDHVTFSETGGLDRPNGKIINGPGGGTELNLTVRNSLFSMPLSTLGVFVDNGSSAITQTAGTNLRYTGTGVVAAEGLTGTIITGDPLLGPDLYHLNGAGPALGAGVNIGITDDIDGDVRSGTYDLGADQSGPPVASAHRWELY